MPKLYVINSKGEKEPLSFRKIYRSARRVGAPAPIAKKIAEIVQEEIRPGVRTSYIFKRVRELLLEQLPAAALRFDLKKGIRELGPTGFPFEKYIAEIFLRNNFKVHSNQFIHGQCATHEIDFLARKKKNIYIGECKYHNLAGGRVDIKVALANYARFLDIESSRFLKSRKLKGVQVKPLLVTNTKFTSQVIRYSQCTGLELLGWNWPKNRGLEHLIDSQKLYPITILPSFKSYLINTFVSKGLMHAQDVLRINPQEFSKKTRTPIKYLEPLIKEARILLES
jgi:hypothetical protein